MMMMMIIIIIIIIIIKIVVVIIIAIMIMMVKMILIIAVIIIINSPFQPVIFPLDPRLYIIDQTKAFSRQKIPKSDRVIKYAADINILVTLYQSVSNLQDKLPTNFKNLEISQLRDVSVLVIIIYLNVFVLTDKLRTYCK